MQKYLYTVLFVMSTLLLISQNNNSCQIKNNAFKSGEKLDYVITYNWAFIWTDVGGVKF